MALFAIFILLALAVIRFQAFFGAMFQIIMVVLVIGAGANLFMAYTNNAAVAVGLEEPFTLPLDQESLRRDVRLSQINTILTSDRDNIPTLYVTGLVENNSIRPIHMVVVTCFASHYNGQRSYPIPLTANFTPGQSGKVSGSITLKNAISRENPMGTNCALTGVGEAN